MLHMSYAADTGSGSAIPSEYNEPGVPDISGNQDKDSENLDAKYYITVPGPTISIMAGEIKRYAYGEEPDEIWLELEILSKGRKAQKKSWMQQWQGYSMTIPGRQWAESSHQSYTGLR